MNANGANVAMALKSKTRTFLKESPKQSADLCKTGLYELQPGTIVPTGSVETVGTHLKITQYAYKDHFEFLSDQPQETKTKNMSLSDRGLDFIKEHEGLRLEAYQDSAGVWTIGYGHTQTAEPGMEISEQEAERLLEQDLERFEEGVRKYVEVPLTQGQYDALVSFAFNLGVGALKESTLLEELNEGNYQAAKSEFKRWVYAGGRRLEGLVKRRKHEAEMFAVG